MYTYYKYVSYWHSMPIIDISVIKTHILIMGYLPKSSKFTTLLRTNVKIIILNYI